MSPLYEKLISLSKQHAANVYRSYEQWWSSTHFNLWT